MNLLADHFGPILIILSPIYKLFPNAITLLVLQAAFVGFSSIPIYFIAFDKTKRQLESFLITFLYLYSQGILAAINFDFHLATISVLPLSLIIYSYYFKKWRLYFLTIFSSLLFKEDLSIFVFGLGLYQSVTRQAKVGLVTVLISVSSFYLIKFHLMPSLWQGGDSNYIGTSSLPLTNPLTLATLLLTKPYIFIDIFTNSPIKTGTLTILYRQYAFLPMLSLFNWFTVLPYLLLRFSSNYTALWTTNFHHSANLEPFLAVGTIFVISRFPLLKIWFYFIITLIILSAFYPNTILLEPFNFHLQDWQKYQKINKILTDIPSMAAVSAQSPFVAHIASREKIYLYPEVLDAQYIVLDSSKNSYPIQPQELFFKVEQLKQTRASWQIYRQQGDLIIFKRL